EGHVGADQRERAVREVDDPHHPEHQREPRSQQRVDPAEEDTVHERVDPAHACPLPRPKYASVTCSRLSSPALPSSTSRPSSMQTTRVAAPIARARSCSTSTIVVPSATSRASEAETSSTTPGAGP